MLSSYQQNLADDLEVKVGGEKLCLTLDDKKNYICHYRNLKLYLEMGLEIRKIRRILKSRSGHKRPKMAENTKDLGQNQTLILFRQ